MPTASRLRFLDLSARQLAVVAAIPWIITVAVACNQDGKAAIQEEAIVPEKSIEAVLKEHTDSLMSLPGVVGTGQGECSGQPCIRVFVVEKTEELLKQIPSAIDGYQVAVDETGEIKALDEAD